MNKVRQLLIVLPLSCLLAGFAILSFLLDSAFVPDIYRISSLVIVTLWAFFITPTILFAVNWMKGICEKVTDEQAFRVGARIGVCLGFDGIVILCFLLSPVIGTIWFVQTIKEASSAINEKRLRSEQSTDAPDIFDI